MAMMMTIVNALINLLFLLSIDETHFIAAVMLVKDTASLFLLIVIISLFFCFIYLL